ncbi:uncharacterized protein [Bos taurus]|uniref:uncharacterized protein n=1 Tax=Bos taurus TaxID=9913 RepID=UPI0028CB7968|nr:uncharacterized protein LOC101904375 [Bos taurus]
MPPDPTAEEKSPLRESVKAPAAAAGDRGRSTERAKSGEAGAEIPSVPRPPHALPTCTLYPPQSPPPGPDWARSRLRVLIGGARCSSLPPRAASLEPSLASCGLFLKVMPSWTLWGSREQGLTSDPRPSQSGHPILLARSVNPGS